MDDLISRQEAINKVEMLAKKYFDYPVILRSVRDMIEQLPSAQPEIIRCDECRYFIRKSHRCEPLGLITCDGFWCKQAERRNDG